ncbi:MAG: hypothetical protein R2932_43475 [Caldilineaceae bacterium]
MKPHTLPATLRCTPRVLLLIALLSTLVLPASLVGFIWSRRRLLYMSE